jgi:hypothetical protein
MFKRRENIGHTEKYIYFKVETFLMALTGEDGSIQFTSSLLTLRDVKELSYWTIHGIFKGQQGHCALQFLQKFMLQHIGQPPRLLRVEMHQGP